MTTGKGTAPPGNMIGSSMILVLGVGNVLRSDDGIGVRVIEALQSGGTAGYRHRIAFRDGGTLGLSLLPEIENAAALIAVDAAETGGEPGIIRSFEGAAMDAQLGGRKRTVHEAALADLMGAAALTGRKPHRRALVAIQPGSTDWGTVPTELVSAAIPAACALVRSLIERWDREN